MESFTDTNASLGPVSGRLFVPEAARHLPVQYAFANVSGAGDTPVIAAQPGKKHRVVALAIVANADVSAHFRSSATPISATWPLGAKGGIVLPENRHGWFETVAGEALNINLSGAVITGVSIVYVTI